MAVTLQDVARECGMDISTVSRGLRGDARVKAATRERIIAAADTLGYVPNLAARMLAAGKTGTVLFITPSLDNPLEREPVEHAARFLFKAGYDLLTGVYHRDPDVFIRLVNRLNQGVADGAIIIPGGEKEGADPYSRLLERKFPLVFLDRHPRGMAAPVVTTDNRRAAAELVRRCVDAGADRAIMLFGDNNAVEAARRDGAVEALHEHGIPQVGVDDLATGGILAIIATNQNGIGTVLAENAGNLKGRRMVIGCFDGWVGEPHPAERVFTAVQDFNTMAHRAVDRILGMIDGSAPVKPGFEPIPVQRINEVYPMF